MFQPIAWYLIYGTYNLEELWVANLDDGLFYEDSQKVYYFIPSVPLNDESTYRLTIETNETNSPITAETDLIDGSGLSFNFLFGRSEERTSEWS